MPTANIMYIPHGGGPLPLLGDPNHKSLVGFLTELPRQFKKPSAIIMISAHWEESQPTITCGTAPELIYDYYGFPAAAYNIQYPAIGDPALAIKLQQLLHVEGFDAAIDNNRGFDHGMFVPLKLMYPKANIPCIQLSLVKGLDPQLHINMGKAIAKLADKDILVVGSGMSFHNMQAFMSGNSLVSGQSEEFTDWLLDTFTNSKVSEQERQNRLINWQQAPHARFCHPRAEHLLPLHVCAGMAMAMANSATAQVIYQETLMKQSVLGLRW